MVLGMLYVMYCGAPQYLYEILPIAALIGSVLGLGTLASNSELIVMRSVGVSLLANRRLGDSFGFNFGGAVICFK